MTFNTFEDFEKELLIRKEYASNVIMGSKRVFKYFWDKYKQIYKFDLDAREIIENYNPKLLLGTDILSSLKKLPFNTFIIKPTDILNGENHPYRNRRKNLQRIFCSRLYNRTNWFEISEDNLVMVSHIIVENYIYLFFAPTNYKGMIGKSAYIVRINYNLTMDENFENIYKDLMSHEEIRISKKKQFGDNFNEVSYRRKLDGYIKNVLACTEILLKYLLYLSECYNKVLSMNIKYIDGERVYNIVNEHKNINSMKEISFQRKYNNSEEVIYYKKNDLGNGTSKSTHTRRGHQHRYWVGSGNKKRLVTKWVKPIIVNEGKNELSTVINNIN